MAGYPWRSNNKQYRAYRYELDLDSIDITTIEGAVRELLPGQPLFYAWARWICPRSRTSFPWTLLIAHATTPSFAKIRGKKTIEVVSFRFPIEEKAKIEAELVERGYTLAAAAKVGLFQFLKGLRKIS